MCIRDSKETEFDIIFGKGISKEGDILDFAVANGIIEKSGAWFAYNGYKIGQGRENAKAFLEANPQLANEITNMAYSQIRQVQETGSADVWEEENNCVDASEAAE